MEKKEKEDLINLIMKKPELKGWQVIVNENGIELATLNRNTLVEILEYIDYLEKLDKDPNKIINWVDSHIESMIDFYADHGELQNKFYNAALQDLKYAFRKEFKEEGFKLSK